MTIQPSDRVEAARDVAASLPPINKLINRDFVKEVDDLLIAVKNLIDRRPPPSVSKIPGYSPFLLVAAHAARNTFDTVRYLLANSKDPYRKLEFCLSVSPSIRFLSDLLATIIVIRQKPKKYVKWYHRSGWRELKEITGAIKNRARCKKETFSRNSQTICRTRTPS